MQNKSESVTIAVMGATGVGKSTFVDLVTGCTSSDVLANDRLESSTERVIAGKPFGLDGKTITMIDTPGFDQTTERNGAQILRLISDFLANSYKEGKKLNGILFFCRISDYRVGGAAQGDFLRFRKLCGDSTLKNVVIVTTMWDVTPHKTAEQREQEMAQNPAFFKAAIDRGAQMARHYNTIQSAHHILRIVLGFPPALLRIQRELVDEGMALSATSGSADLALEAKFIEELAKLEEQQDATIRERDELRRREIQAMTSQLAEVRAALTRVEVEGRALAEELAAEKKRSSELTEELGRRDEELLRERAAREAEMAAAEALREAETHKHDKELRRMQANHEAEVKKAMEEFRKREQERLASLMEKERLQRGEAARRKALEDASRHDEERKRRAVIGGVSGFLVGIGATILAFM